MPGDAQRHAGPVGSRWRLAAWGTAAALLLLPLVAMQITDEVAWDLADFAFAGVLVVGVGLIYELAARKTGSPAYRAAVAVALAAAFILVWLNAAVGLIGAEDNSANLIYGGVLAVAALGAVMARFQPGGMARALVATALAHMMVALIAGWGSTASGPLEIMILNGVFALLWLISAWLFRAAALEPTRAHACARED
jgi:hypothetical protein